MEKETVCIFILSADRTISHYYGVPDTSTIILSPMRFQRNLEVLKRQITDFADSFLSSLSFSLLACTLSMTSFL